MGRRGLAGFACVGATALALAGCGGGGDKIDHTVVEKAIEVSVARQQHQIVVVACPKGIEAKKGRAFRCIETTATGRQYPFKVTVKDSKGNVHFVGSSTRIK